MPAAFGTLLPSTGEMADRIREFDWAGTPVGLPETWSSSLRTTLATMLGSRHPMFLWWGPELIQFYNDGYRPSLGRDRHPDALGARGRIFWAEIWDAIGPQIDGVMTRGDSTWNEDHLVPIARDGRLHEVYWTYSFSPVRDDDGRIGGTLVVVQEQTRRVLSERRLRALRELAAHGAASRTEDETWRGALDVLAAHPRDVAWTSLFVPEARSDRFVAFGGDSSDRRNHAPRWPLAAAGASGPLRLDDVRSRVGDTFGTVWPEPVESALVLPIGRPGAGGLDGVLVAGISPRLDFDDDYRDFLALTANQIATAVANARASAAERQRAESLAALDHAKSAFLSSVSHELRTPLALILGPLESLQRLPLPPPAAEQLQMMRRSALRLLRLVNTLLDLSRIEAGRADGEFRRADIAALTRELAGAFQSLIEGAGLRFTVTTETIDDVYIDRDMWERIVLNLLSNAFKFTLAGEIRVDVERRGATVALIVRDTGIGIPAAELPHVLERFHRVRSRRGRTDEGSGIGLALVHELVTLHGGTIAIESREDHATAITVTLPIGHAHLPAGRVTAAAAVDAATPAQRQLFLEEAARWSAEPLTAAAADGRAGSAAAERPRIVFVDDNADMRTYITSLLTSHYDVRAAPDAASALTAIRAAVPDLVLSDVMLPGMSGLELLQALRSDARTAAVPVVLLSARAGEDARIEGWHAGADDYLEKPFAARELMARIEAQLLRARLAAASRRADTESRLKDLALDAGRLGSWRIDLKTQERWSSDRCKANFGLPADAPLSYQDVIDAQHPDDRALVRERMATAIATGTDYVAEYRVIWPDGSVHWLSARGRTMYGEAGEPLYIAGNTLDITDEKNTLAALQETRDDLERRVAERTADLRQSHERLAVALAERTALEAARTEWLRAVINAQEDERRRVAHELHDEMAQHLTGLMLGLHQIERTPPEQASGAVAQLKELVSGLERGAYRLARGLRPPALDDLGLIPALTTLVAEWSQQAGVAADFVHRNARRLPSTVETTAYRVVQEALTNVARHARARTASVVLECLPDRLLIIVEDDGRGFEVNGARTTRGERLGIVGMRERCTLVGGTLRIESAPANGTSVFVTLPLGSASVVATPAAFPDDAGGP